MKSLKSHVQDILDDHTHGSTFLLNKIIHLLKTCNSPKERAWAFRELDRIDPAMKTVHHFLHAFEAVGEDAFDGTLKKYVDQWRHAEEQIAWNLSSRLPNKSLNMLTHSHSGVVIRVMEHLSDQGFKLHFWQTESLPGGEGILQADTFKKLGFRVNLLKDHAAFQVIERMDACVLGVDQYDHRCFVNKRGSGEIVRIAAPASCPVYVLGDTRKGTDQVHISDQKIFETVDFQSHVYLITEASQNH